MAFLSNILRTFQPGHAFLGLEITDSFIKIAEIITTKGKKPVISKFVLERLPPDTMEDGRLKNPLLLHRLIQQIVKMNDFQTNKVHLVLPSSVIMVRYLKLPNLPDKSLNKVIEFELKHHIHLPFEHPYFDFVNMSAHQLPEAQRAAKPVKRSKAAPAKETDLAWKEAAPAQTGGSPAFTTADSLFSDLEKAEDGQEAAPQADVLLVAAPQEFVDEYTSLLRECGLKPVSAEIKALALFRFILAAEPQLSEQTLLTVDLNETSADISIFHEGLLKITRNVLVHFPAEQTKEQKKLENALFASFVALDTDAEFNNACSDLAHELERLMNFYRYTLNNRAHEFRTTVLTGDSHRLQDISRYLEDRLNQGVIQPRTDWLYSRVPSAQDSLPKLAIPIGLGLRGNDR